MSHNLYESLSRSWVTSPTAPIVGVPGGPSYTGAELAYRSRTFAEVLREAGACAGDRVVAHVDRTPDAAALYLACLGAGFIYVPLDPSCSSDHLGFVLGDVEPAVFVCKEGRAAKLGPLAALVGARTTLTLSPEGTGTLAAASDGATGMELPLDRRPDDIACIAYTAGTTGRPKGAMLTHGAIATNARSVQAAWRFGAGDVLLQTSPISDVHGWFTSLHVAVPAGARVLYSDKPDPTIIRQLLAHVTVLSGPPALYAELAAGTDIGREQCRMIRMMVCSSGPLPRDVASEFTRRTGHTILEHYVVTELGILTSSTADVRDPANVLGHPLPGISVRLADENAHPVEAGKIGEIQLRCDRRFRGYWQRDDQTADAMTIDGYFRTGDLGSMLVDGRLTMTGRLGDAPTVMRSGHECPSP